jgi:hypothetical protein
MNEENLDDLFVPLTENGEDMGFEPLPQEATIEPPMFPEDSYGGRMLSQMQNRIENTQESAEMMMQDEQTYLETAAQGFGQVLMAGNDAVSESILSFLSTMDFTGAMDFLGDYIEQGADNLMSTDTAQYIYNQYLNMDPRAQKDLDAAFNIGLSMVPFRKKMSTQLIESGINAEKKSIGKYVLDQGPRAQAARNGEIGMERDARTVNNREDRVLNTLLTVKGIGATTPRPKMMGAMNKEIARLGKDINKALRASNVYIPKGTMTKRINSRLAQFRKDNPEYATKHLTNTVKKAFDAYIAANKKAKYTGRPEELLEVRRKFDDIAQTYFNVDWEAGNDSSRRILSVIREELNQMIQETAPDAAIRQAMARQHDIMIAKDNLKYNMVAEKSLTDKAVAKVEHHPYLVGGALGGSGMLSNMAGNEAVGAALGLGALGYGLSRPPVRKYLGLGMESLGVTPARSLFVDAANETVQRAEEQQ